MAINMYSDVKKFKNIYCKAPKLAKISAVIFVTLL